MTPPSGKPPAEPATAVTRPTDPRAAIERVTRDESTRILATLIRFCGGDFQRAEDAVQEAMAAGLRRWPNDGIPRDPAAWILTTAKRKAIDLARRERTAARARETFGREIAILRPGDGDGFDLDHDDHDPADAWTDDRLRLIFTCCHPALALEARVALTLRVVAGLQTDEIARAFLVSEATMAQRIVRAKRKIRDARIPYEIPRPDLLHDRLTEVLAVVYLVFNEGYAATSGDALVRPALTREAIRLGQLVSDLLPDEPEARGLLALMLLHDARSAARVDQRGALMTLEEQDRSLWDRAQIARGVELVESALRQRRPGPFQIQAAIAALHAEAAVPGETDWRQIALLYRELGRYQQSPVIALNHAVAVAMVEGWELGLRLLDDIERAGTLSGHHLFHASRAELLRRAGERARAAEAYRRALAHCKNDVERRYLQRRLCEVEAVIGTEES
jgi:RNA polymerase sigma-70 factor, ECF subfamily